MCRNSDEPNVGQAKRHACRCNAKARTTPTPPPPSSFSLELGSLGRLQMTFVLGRELQAHNYKPSMSFLSYSFGIHNSRWPGRLPLLSEPWHHTPNFSRVGIFQLFFCFTPTVRDYPGWMFMCHAFNWTIWETSLMVWRACLLHSIMTLL